MLERYERFIKKINNEALVGTKCEADSIQKILIYQLCASEASLVFRADQGNYLFKYIDEKAIKLNAQKTSIS